MIVKTPQPGEEKAMGRSYSTIQHLKGAYKKAVEGLLIGTRRSGSKLQEGGFRLSIREKFLAVRVMRHWNRLP